MSVNSAGGLTPDTAASLPAALPIVSAVATNKPFSLVFLVFSGIRNVVFRLHRQPTSDTSNRRAISVRQRSQQNDGPAFKIYIEMLRTAVCNRLTLVAIEFLLHVSRGAPDTNYAVGP